MSKRIDNDITQYHEFKVISNEITQKQMELQPRKSPRLHTLNTTLNPNPTTQIIQDLDQNPTTQTDPSPRLNTKNLTSESQQLHSELHVHDPRENEYNDQNSWEIWIQGG